MIFRTSLLILILHFCCLGYSFQNSDNPCIPYYGVGCEFGDAISRVKLNGETINLDNSSECGQDGFEEFLNLPQPDLVPGSEYNLQVTTDSSWPMLEEVKAWIDFNNDGIFQDDEEIVNTNGEGMEPGERTFSFTVPSSANPGSYRMRVRLVDSPFFDSCDDQYYGETEDYMIQVIQLEECTGTPTAGSFENNLWSVCSDTPFHLSVNNSSGPALGMESHWEWSAPGEDNWTPVPNAQSSNFLLENGISEATDFRFVISCSYSGETDISDIMSVEIKPLFECYCTPEFEIGCDWGDYINQVYLEGETITLDNNTECSENGYEDYSNLTAPDLAPGGFYSITLSTASANSAFQEMMVWIDFDKNGSFEENEKIVSSDGEGMGTDGIKTFNFSIPEDIEPDQYKMRVRLGNTPFLDACEFDYYGEIEDYEITIIELNDCQGNPSAGSIVQSSTDVCLGDNFMLSTSGASFPALGFEKVWQSSAVGEEDWTDIEGSDSNPFLLENIQEPKDYRFKITCLNSQETDISDSITIGLKDAVECYCIPHYSYGCFSDDNISNVTLEGENVSLNNDSWCSENHFGDFTDLTPPDFIAGETYTLSISTDSYYPEYLQAKAWVDFNNDGFFDENEVIFNTDGLGLESTTTNFEFNVPADLESDVYRLRIRVADSYMGFDACEGLDSGEAEDYMIEVFNENSCEETPHAGVIDITEISVCPEEGFVVSTSDSSVASDELQTVWQYSLNPDEEWNDIPDSEDPVFSVLEGISELTFYRYKVVCVASGLTAYSDIIEVDLNPIEDCYCIPSYSIGCQLGDNISEVYLAGETVTLINPIDDDDPTCSEDGYNDFTHLNAPDLFPGENYSINIYTDYPSPEIEQVKGWIDFNENGIFEEDEEFINSNGVGLVGGMITLDFIIPENTEPGVYRMRLRLSDNNNFDACSEEYYGETEDYSIEILELDSCQGSPSPGQIDQDDMLVCAGESFTLSVSNAAEPANGMERTWEYAALDEDTWHAVEEATTDEFFFENGIDQPRKFRFKISCAFSQQINYSDIITVNLKDFEECYCTPENTFGDAFQITHVSTQGGVQNLNKDSEFSDLGYADYTESDTLKVLPGQEIIFTTEFTVPENSIQIWVDWNQNGSFEDSGEKIIDSGGNQDSPYVASFLIPDTISNGFTTRLRIRNGKYGSPNSCEDFSYGETEDYTIEVLPPQICEGTPFAGTPASTLMNVCSGESFSLSVNGASDPAINLERTWQYSLLNEDNWQDIENKSASSVVIENGIEEPTQFRYKVNCLSSGETDYSDVIEVYMNPFDECYCIPTNSFGCSSSHISNVSLIGFSKILNNTTGCSDNNYGDYTHLTPVDLIAGETYSIQITTGASLYLWDQVRAWIDYNNNGVFDAEEEILNTNNNGLEDGSGSFEFIVPDDLEIGNYRLRIRLIHNGGDSIDPCANSESQGETEDYLISIVEDSPCLPPNNLEVNTITKDSAVISWDSDEDDTAWEILYGEEGFNTESSGTSFITDSTNFSLEELTPNTTYDVYVSTQCEGLESLYAGPLTFTTECDVAELPFIQDFEDISPPEIPNCDSTQNLSNGNNWETYYLESSGFEGNVLRYSSSPTYDADAWYFTQGIYLEANTNYKISYKYGNISGVLPESMKVTYGLNPDASDVIETLSDHPAIIATSSQTNLINFTVDSEGVYYFGFNVYSEAGQLFLYLDDIVIDYGGECPAPTDITIQEVTGDSAIISWTPLATDTAWEIVYGPVGSDENETIFVEGESEILIEDLSASTEYEVSIKAFCAEDTESELSEAVTFTTGMSPPVNNKICDAIEIIPNQDCEGNTFNNIGAYPQSDEPIGSCFNVFYGTNSVWFYFMAPTDGEIIISTDSEETDFSTEITVFESSENCEDIDALEEVGCAANGEQLVLNQLHIGEIYYVKITGFNNSEGHFCLQIQAEIPELCLSPELIFLSDIDQETAHVSWSPVGNETSWEVKYGESGFNPDTEGISFIVNDPEIDLVGLLPNTEYEIYIRSICNDDLESDWSEVKEFITQDLSLISNTMDGFKFYPNPLQNQLTLKADSEIEQIRIFNLLGQRIVDLKPNKLNLQIDTDHLSSDLYFMEIQIKGNKRTFKLIKN